MSPPNLAASIRAKLLNHAKAQGADFNLILTQFGLERMLYRLSVSSYAQRFLLKGALLFNLWHDLPRRPTRDADLLGYGSSEIADLIQVFQDICRVQCEDGVIFLPDSVTAEPIRKDAGYPGVRITLRGELDGARCLVQVDIGFGDAVTPEPETTTYPVLLDGLPIPTVRAYSRYSVVAEKLHIIVVRGVANSRLKDYFDLWIIASYSDLDGRLLARALTATFARRETALPENVPVGLTDGLLADNRKQNDWRAFLNKNKLSAPDLADVVVLLRTFLIPAMEAARGKTEFKLHWRSNDRWQ